MKISYEDKMLILGLYHAGEKMTGICVKSHRSNDTVRRVLKEYGLKVPHSYTKITTEIREEAIALNKSGMSYRSIAGKLGIGVSTVRDICAGYKKQILDDTCLEKSAEEQQMELPIPNEINVVPIEALRMIRDALNMIIEHYEVNVNG